MKKNVVIPLILLTSGVLLGGGGTYFVYLASSTNVGSDPSERVARPQTEGALPKVESEIDDAGATNSASSTHASNAIEDPSLHKIAFQRKLTIYSYVDGLSEQQITTELEGTLEPASSLSSRVRKELQTALIEKLAVLNPVAALKFSVDSNDLSIDFGISSPLGNQQYALNATETEFMPVVRSVFKEWALSDLDDAVESAKTLSESARMNALAGILSTLSGEPLTTLRDIAKTLGDEEQGIDAYVMSFRTATVAEPKAIWTELITLVKSDHYYKTQILGNVAEQWYKKDGIRVLDQINATPLDENRKSNLIRRVLHLAATNNPQEAFQYAQTLSTDRRYSSSVYNVVDIWAKSDPQAAYQAVTRVEQSRDRERLQTTVVHSWASNEPYYYLNNLDKFPSSTREIGISGALATIAKTSPQEAAELALEQKDEGFMSMLSFMLPSVVISPWVEQDVEAAVNWVLSGPVPEDKRHNWVRALTTDLVSSDPRRAFEIALKQPKVEGGLEAFMPSLESDIISQIVRRDLDLAIELLPKLPKTSSRVLAYASVGDEYIDLGDSKKAVSLGLQLPIEEQVNYFESIASTWARTDPGGLVESIKDLPTPELRSSIAQEVSSRRLKENFTDAQLEELKQHFSESN